MTVYIKRQVFQKRNSGFSQFEISQATAGTSDAYVIPRDYNDLLIGIYPGIASSAKLQYSLSSLDDITAGTAEWQDWDAGSVSVDTTDTLYVPVAVRLVVSSGSATLAGVLR